MLHDVLENFQPAGGGPIPNMPYGDQNNNIMDTNNNSNSFFGVPDVNNATQFANTAAYSQSPVTLANSSSLHDSPVNIGADPIATKTDSPIVDGEMEVWDDMVNQFGMENPQAQFPANGAAHLGMVHWF
jgi:hypothetical protein